MSTFVIACGDEGVQLNQGTRLGIAGSGFRLGHFSDVVKALKKLFGKALIIVSSDEDEWVKRQLNLSDWGQVNASAQQHIEALADREKLRYAGHLTFTDPKLLKYGVKGHMVRPHKVHIANKICFTCGGGEQVFNLGSYVISAEWVSSVPLRIAREVITAQVEFYQSLAKKKLAIVFELGGELGEKAAVKNKKIVEKLGFVATTK